MNSRRPHPHKGELRSTFWLAFIQSIRVIGGFLVGVVVVRYLGASDYGALMLAVSLSGIFSAFGTLGLPRVLFNELVIPKSDNRALFASALLLLMFSGLIGTLGTYFVCLALDQPNGITIMAIITSFAMVFNGGVLVQQVFLVNHTLGRGATAQLSGLLFSLSYRVGAVLFKAPVLWFALANVLQNFFVFLISLWLARPALRKLSGQLRPQTKEMRRLLVLTTPLFFASLLQGISLHSDRVLLGTFLTATDVATYAVLLQVLMIPQLLVSSIVGGASPRLVPLLSTLMPQDEHAIVELLSVATGLSLLALAALTIFGPLVVPFIYGEEFTIELAAFFFVGIGALANAPNTLRFEFLLAQNLQALATKIAFFNMVFGILFQFVFIYNFGFIGAPLAYACQSVFYAAILNFFYDDLRPYRKIYFKSIIRGITLIPLYKKYTGLRR